MSQLTVDIGEVIRLLRRTPAWAALDSKLKMRDTVFIVDDSASMTGDDCLTRDGRRHVRWEVAIDLLEVLVGVASEFDADGVDVLFLNRAQRFKILAGQPVRPELDRRGIRADGSSTPLGQKLRQVMLDGFENQLCPQVPHDHHHIREEGDKAHCVNSEQPTLRQWGCPFEPPQGYPRREAYVDGSRTVFCTGGSGFKKIEDLMKTPGPGALKPLNLVVLTDGEASDKDLLHRTLQQYPHFCHDHSSEMLREPKDYISLQFVQVGKDRAAKLFIGQLDNDYKGHQFDDYVDAIHWDSVIAGVGGVSREHLIAVMVVKSLCGGMDSLLDGMDD